MEVDPDRNRLRLTLKKSLVEAHEPIISSYEVESGALSLGTLVSVKPHGAVVEFLNGVRAFLPASEISENFVANSTEVFSPGQTVKIRVINTQPEENKMRVSCRLAQLLPENVQVFEGLEEGSIVQATVTDKFKDTIVVDLSANPDSASLLATIEPGHLADDFNKVTETAKKYNIGDTIEVVILEKQVDRKIASVSAKPSLIKDVKNHKLPFLFQDVKKGQKLHGFISSVRNIGAFVTFGGGLTALVLSHDLGVPKESLLTNQSVDVVIRKIDAEEERIFASIASVGGGSRSVDPLKAISGNSSLSVGDKVTAKVTRVKPTHLDVNIDGTEGRVDVSLVCSASAIVDAKNVTAQFEPGQTVKARVVSTDNGVHLSLRPEDLAAEEVELPSIEQAEVGSEWTVYVVSRKDDILFVNVTPEFKGKMTLLDAGKDIEDCPIGSSLKCHVIIHDDSNVYFRASTRASISTFSDAKVGDVVPAMVIKPYDMYVLLRLGAEVVASAFATEASNSYARLGDSFRPFETVTAKITAIDSNKQRISVSLRSEDVSGSTSEEVTDKSIKKLSDVNTGDVVRGFVSNVSNGGVFVALNRTISGRIQIKEISDTYVRDWKQYFKVGQVVKAKVLSKQDDRIELSVRPSQVGETLVPQLEVGNERAGTVERIEDYGVFVRLDSGEMGLCHTSQVADKPVKDLTKVFSIGDPVKVKVLSIDAEKRRIGLGMKASYFGDEEDEEMSDENAVEEDEGSEMEVDEESDEELDLDHIAVGSSDEEEEESDEESSEQKPLSVGFDWTSSIMDQLDENTVDTGDMSDENDEDDDEEEEQKVRRKKKKTQITEDRTGSLNTKLPQSIADFERLIVGSPNSSVLWINFMAFQLQLSEIDKAREIAKRALDTINFREEQEKQNIWIALLNLENSFGTEQTLEEVFKDAVRYMDAKTMHLKLANIYAQSGKVERAISTYRTIIKKFGADDVSLWTIFGTYLIEQQKSTEAHALLDQALKTLPRRDHRDVISKFAQLEYSKGDIERGRTLFEGLVSAFARRVDLWNIYIDQEIKAKQRDAVEKLFERVIAGKLSMKQAKFFFKKWLTFEDKFGDDKSVDYVKSKAAEYVASRQKPDEEEEDEEEE